ncbi:Hypothetical predicted protein [Cloeon dipterum]|uniref:C-type lectin domain-containing protein n=1 Tax=Cloeon dipterum TaxID=197152 RepID=A0A8S1DBH3_9INSE|nr:Hypothetical predicted protein [Cloeon dipterum]
MTMSPVSVLLLAVGLCALVPISEQQTSLNRNSKEITRNDCSNCVDDSLGSNTINRWTMPLLKLGEKRYYLGIFFKANWYKANRYCRYHGMQLASIDTEEENKFLQETIASQGSWAGQVASQRLTLGGFLSLPRE